MNYFGFVDKGSVIVQSFAKILLVFLLIAIYQASLSSAIENKAHLVNSGDNTHLVPAPPRISGFVWEDLDGNGQQGGEPGIDGVNVQLLDGTGTPTGLSMTTALGGFYAFEDLAPGQYIVQFDLSGSYEYTAQYIGSSASDSDANPVNGQSGLLNLAALGDLNDIDAGYYLPAAIGNFVWDDLNGDGIQDFGEPGINGVTVTLTGTTGAGAAVNLAQATNPGGFYQFTDIVPGNYRINFAPGGAYVPSVKDAGADDVDSDADETTGYTDYFDVFSGDDLQDWDAGFFLLATVSNFVWEDLNYNGAQDVGEPGIDGVDVEISGTTGAGAAYFDNTVTAGGGLYAFDDVPPGNYTLNFGTPGGYNPTVMDAAGDTVDSDADETSGDTDPFDLISDQVNNTKDAGFYRYATVGDFCWEDMNGNGIQDGEPGVDGVNVDINGTTGAGTPFNDNTVSVGGTYTFDEVPPGNYTLTFTLPGGYDEFTLLDQGADDTDSDVDAGGVTIAFTVESNEVNLDWDAGMYKYVHVGDFCWEDMNGNGIQDGEPGLFDVKVRATRVADGNIKTKTSDASGFYEFTDLTPGEYYFNFGGPAGYFITAQDQTGDDSDSDPDPGTGNTVNMDFESGDADASVDGGFYLPASIGDYTWRDSNTDGIQDVGENDFPSIDVNLSGNTGNGVPVSLSTTTDGAGAYRFSGLVPGQYQVEFITPASYTTSPYQAGGDPTVDSDAPISDIILLESGQNDITIDAGFFVEPPEDCDQQPANACEDAEVLCDIEDIHDFCTVMLSPWSPGVPNPLCPTGGFSHNPSWFAFVAAAETVTLIIHASDCSVGGGLQIGIQYGIYEACGPPWNPIICQPNCELPGDITVTSSNFTPGEDYFFFIDGCNGTICTYWIEIVEGGGFYAVTDPTGISCDDPDDDCENVCLGNTIEFNLDETDDATDYFWEIDGVIDGNLTEQTVSILFSEEGTYEICGWGSNACDKSDEVCITVTVEAEEDVDLGPFEVCADVLSDPGFEPPDWEGGVITTPGEYSIEVYNEFNCLYTQLVKIIELPNETAEIDTVACFGDVISLLGTDFSFDTEDYPLIDVGGSANGCDRYVNFSATFLNLEYADLEGPLCLGNSLFELTIDQLAIQPALVDNVSVQWYWGIEKVGGLLTTPPYSIQVDQEGIYRAEVTITKNGQSCTFEIDDLVEIFFENLNPPTPEQNTWTLEYCNNANDTIVYAIFHPDFGNTYTWTYPDDVMYAYVDIDLATLFIDWTGSEGGEICVQAENECGISEIYCEYITINPGPNAEFSAPDTLCLTDLASVEYTGYAGSNADYVWTFNGGVDTSGNNDQGPGPYILEWSSAGPKNITLVVEENGCLSAIEQKTVYLEPPLQSPLINCISNQSEINFTWDSIPNAAGYQVELLQGTAGVYNGTEYTVTGLNPLDSVTIIVSALSGGYCPPTLSDTTTCFALDCPPVSLDILVQDTSICYEGGGTPFILDHLISPDDIGVITWSGPGIIDPNTGLFNPDSAGFGSHTIRLRYIVDNCTFNDQATINIYQQPTADFITSSDSICNTEQLLINYTGNSPGATASWTFDSPATLTGQNLNQHRATWLTEGWKTITLQVEKNGCISDLESQMVYVEEALGPIDIDCAPSVDSVVFFWPFNDQIEGYLIYVNGTLVDSLNVTSWTVDGLNEGDLVSFTLEGINKGICANTSGQQDCEAEACPEFIIDVTPVVDTICLVTGIAPIQFESNLTGATKPGDALWGGNGIDPATGMFDPILAGPGTHTISYRYAEGSCDIDTSFSITLLEQPVTDFSIDKDRICITDRIVITTNNYNPAFQYDWSLDNASTQPIANDQMEAFWSAPGTYNLSLIVSNEICVATEQNLTVVVEPELVAPQISCDQYTDQIILNWTSVDCAASYQIFVDGNLFAETAANQVTIDNLDPSQELDIELIALSECACPNIATTLQCSTLDCENVELSIEELPYGICEDEVASFMTLHANVVGSTGGTLGWSGNFISANGDDGVVQLDMLSPGEHFFSVSYDKANCHYDFSDALTIHPAVRFTATATDPSCHNMTNGSISIQTEGGTAPFLYFLNGVALGQETALDLAAGNYTIQVTDQNTCDVEGSAVLTNPELILPSISGLEVLQENQTSTYSLAFQNQPQDALITWYTSGGDTLCRGANCMNVDLNIEDETTVCADIQYNAGACVETACIDIRFEEIVDVYIPNVFSPNNDDQNDMFYIKADESVSLVKSMSIFDRWGELIFSRANFAPNESDLGWDGSFNGKRLLPGVYVYDIVILTRENKEFRYSGDITLIR